MRNVIAFILAALMSVAIVFVASLLFFPGEEKVAPEEDPETQIVLTVSQSDHRSALYNFNFSLDDEEYSLPCRYGVFESNGWVLRNPEELIEGGTNMTGVYMKKSGRSLKTEIINYSKDTVMCCRGQVHCISANVSDFEKIDIPGAVSFDSSTTPAVVKQMLGDPDLLEEDDEKITLTYRKTDYKNVKFIFYKKRSFEDFDYSQTESGQYSEPFASGYYEHVIVIECRKDF